VSVQKKDILSKLYIISILFVVLMIAVVVKIVDIQWYNGDKYREEAFESTIKNFSIPANRGNIYTADGNLLATSVTRYDVRMDVVTVSNKVFEKDVNKLAESLANMFHKTASFYRSYLKQARKNKNRYLFIARNLDYNNYIKIKHFPIFKLGTYKGGLIIEQKTKREHPLGKIGERLLGYDDYRGEVGLEGSFNKYLKGKKGKLLKQKIANGQWKPIKDSNEVDPKDGEDVISTIDLNIQDIAHHALLAQLKKFKADHGSVVVMETKTGQIKAMANLGRTSKGNYFEKRNYAVYESQEPGSTFKLMEMVAALENKVVDTSNIIDTGNGVLTVFRRKVRDAHHGGFGKISVAKVFEYSSNVGMVKIITKGFDNNPQKFFNTLKRMNLDSKLNLSIKGEGTPKIPNPKSKSWNGLSLPWMAYGYGVSFTPLQILTFYNAIANNGQMVKPKFLKEIRNQDKVEVAFKKQIINPKICSQSTINKVKVMMKNVVKMGTAKDIYNPNFSMAGKTGTCQVDYWTGNTQYVASFVGYFPANNPKYSCIVVINKPDKKIGYYGATVAAPVFKKIAQKIYIETPKIKKINKIAPNKKLINNQYAKYYKVASNSVNTIPNVKSMAGMDAVSLLENMGVHVTCIGVGVVVKQSLKPGLKINKKTKITLELS